MVMVDCQPKNSILVPFILVVAMGTFSATLILMTRDIRPVPQLDENATSKCRIRVRTHPDDPNVSSSWNIPRNATDYMEYMRQFCLEESRRKQSERELCPCIPDGLGKLNVVRGEICREKLYLFVRALIY